VADIGAWAEDNPPDTEFVLPGGVQYAMEPFLGGFAVTDGHHNRVIYVRHDGRVRELLAVGNVVPTGLAAAGHTLFMGLAGAVPHLPEDGKVVAITRWWHAPVEIASGAGRPPRPAHAGRRAARPSVSVAFSRRSAFVVTLTGKVLRIDGFARHRW
jgi:hypothetical protein